MLIFPAIDILDGQCVRLKKGEYGTAHKVAEDTLETAKGFERDGAHWIHMVDLNGAKHGTRVNSDVIEKVTSGVSVPVELGGGIRDMEGIEYYLTHGVSRVILGTAALSSDGLVERAVERYGDKIAVGIDSMNGEVRVSGWTEGSGKNYLDFAREMQSVGVDNIIFTDISRDGMLSGPNLEQLSALKKHLGLKITASGGVKDLQDIQDLMDIGVYAAICGKSIYEGTLELRQAVRLSEGAV